MEKVEIEKIRRITGYLTGSVSSWNSAKKAELKDRVKHVGVDSNASEIEMVKN